MTELIELLRAVPNVVWSALIASVLTLSGVLISNWSSTNRLRIQLQHDATEKAKERTATLRRQVYLRAAEELTRANSHLASLPQSDLAQTNAADGLQGFFAEAAKLQLVAEPKTALLVNQLVGTYGELSLRLMSRLMPLQDARTDISINDDLYNKARTDVSRVLDEMAKFNETAKTDEPTFQALHRAFETYQAQAETYADARSAAWDRFNRLNCEFGKQLLVDMRKIGEEQIPVLIEIRRDLGLTAELPAFREQMDAQWKRMEKQINEMISALQEGLNDV